MSVLFDYFAADSDELAASVIDRPGGPGTAATPAPSNTPDRRLFRRAAEQSPVRQGDAPELVLDTVSVQGIDPVVQMGTLEELLTGRTYDDIVEDPRSGHALAMRDGGERLVMTLTDGVTTALLEAGNDRLARVAASWSQTEEFLGDVDPEVISGFLRDLAGLARRANARNQQLYCWVCVQIPCPAERTVNGYSYRDESPWT